MTLTLLTALLLGAVAWTLLEYVIHRWLGHDARTRPNPFASEHVRHHSEGNYFAPSWKKGAAAAVFALVLSGPSIVLAGAVAGSSFVAGLISMYLAYEVAHRRAHTHPGVGRYAKWMRRHHFYHHFTDPHFNHGVTTPFWDWVFGTRRAPGVIRVPPKLAMPWLVDPRTRDVRPEHAAHYALTVAKASPRAQ
jgi:sterol desaturase/sphingolipid hydroxylase (fatty acid hydroxylase superfamily)